MTEPHWKYTDQEIVRILQGHHGEVTAKEIIRRHGISLDTFFCWKRKYSGLGNVELQRLKALQDENRHLSGWRRTGRSRSRSGRDAMGKSGDDGLAGRGRHRDDAALRAPSDRRVWRCYGMHRSLLAASRGARCRVGSGSGCTP